MTTKLQAGGMRNSQDTLYACKRAFIHSFAIYMVVGVI